MKVKIEIIILIIVTSLFAACDKGQDGPATIPQAKIYLQQGDYRSSILTLKNIIRKNPEDKEARQMLGSIDLTIGDGASAEKEFKRAEKLGIQKSQIVAPLSRALVMQGKLDEALSLCNPISNAEPGLNAEILSVKGEVYLAKKKIKDATDAFQQAQKYDATNLASLQGLVRLAIIEKDLKKAKQLGEKLIQLGPEEASVWNIKGVIEAASKKHLEAETSFKKAISLLNEKQISRLGFSIITGLVQEQLQQGKYDEALQNVNILLKAQPNHPLPKYMRAVIAFHAKDYKLANGNLEDVLNVAPSYLPAKFLMGAVQYAMGNYERARVNLQQVVNEVPAHMQARKLLASVYLKLHNPEDALKVLAGKDGETTGDADLLAMMGRAAIATGDLQRGVALYKKAASAAPNEPQIRSELASQYMKEGSYKNAIDELEKIGGTGKKQATKMIIYAHIRQRQYDQAISKTKELEAESPDDASIPTIFGTIELSRGDKDKAKKYFLKSYDMDQSFEPAIVNLARMEFDAGSIDGAEDWFKKAIQKHPGSIRPLLGMALIEEKKGHTKEAMAWVEKAQTANPRELAPINILTKYYIKTHEFQKADVILAKTQKVLPNESKLIELRVSVLKAEGKKEEAIQLLKENIESQPKNQMYYIQLAEILVQNNRLSEAQATLVKAKKNTTATPILISALVKIEAKLGNYEKALQLVKEQQKNKKSSVVWFSLEGDIYMLQKQYQQAEKAYRDGVKLDDSSLFATKLASAKYATGDVSGATKYIKEWIGRHPRDYKGILPLAQLFIKYGNYKEAIPLFEEINNSQKSSNAFILNNLAWLYGQSGDKRAITTAEKAYRLAPKSGAVIDTYGSLLVSSGDLDQGITLLRKASELSDSNQEIKLHLASALAQKAGGTEEASEIVRDLLKKGKLTGNPKLQELQNKLGITSP